MENKKAIKDINIIKNYWDNQPCNVNHSKKKIGSKEYFNEVEKKKYFVEPHIINFVNFPKWSNKKVLEIGMGIGTDAINFAKNGAKYYGIELSEASLNISKKRFDCYNLTGNLSVFNAEENMDFMGVNTFDLVYSFGVIHHSLCPEKIINNAYRLLKSGGTLKIMLYAENSWKKILIDGGFDQYEAQSGCPLAYSYTNEQVYKLLEKFKNINIQQDHIFPYKIIPYKNNIYIKEDYFANMSNELFKLLEKRLGWHLCITAIKP